MRFLQSIFLKLLIAIGLVFLLALCGCVYRVAYCVPVFVNEYGADIQVCPPPDAGPDASVWDDNWPGTP